MYLPNQAINNTIQNLYKTRTGECIMLHQNALFNSCRDTPYKTPYKSVFRKGYISHNLADFSICQHTNTRVFCVEFFCIYIMDNLSPECYAFHTCSHYVISLLNTCQQCPTLKWHPFCYSHKGTVRHQCIKITPVDKAPTGPTCTMYIMLVIMARYMIKTCKCITCSCFITY